MKKVNENLIEYRDDQFFLRLSEQEDAKIQLDNKAFAQNSKDAQDTVKKIKENFVRFKSYAGNQILEYKNFWTMQAEIKKKICEKDLSCKIVYAMFNDSATNKYMPNYVVYLKKTEEGKFCINIIKTHLENNEKNPIVSICDKQAANDFINFYAEVKEELKKVKDAYIKNVETKKQEIEQKQKREKLETFLKESKKDIPRDLKKNKEYQLIQSTQEYRKAFKDYIRDKKEPEEAHRLAFEKVKKVKKLKNIK
jgi:hypothetical protein